MSILGDVTMRMRYTVPKQVRQAFIDAVAVVMDGQVKDEAKELSPYDTGKNKDSIATSTKDGGAIGVVAQITTNSGYGGYLELGHRVRGDSGNMVEGRPYIFPAVTHAGPAIAEILAENLANVRGNE